ncbi:MAG TPA: hypothetical protein VGH10_09555 [Actinomycetota bacterium]|jgi:hypothetical protein
MEGLLAVFFGLWIIGIVLELVFIVLTVRIAAQKGRNPVGWGIFAVFFSLIAFMLVFILPDTRRR